MSQGLMAGVLGMLLLSGCGGAGEVGGAPSEQALVAQVSPVKAMAQEELAAVELAQVARKQPDLSRTFSDYLIIQQRMHQELLDQLQGLEALGALSMSDAGFAMARAVEGLAGEALEARYFAVQRPWQEAVLQRLGSADLPEGYRRSALHRWGRDLAALEALTRSISE